jgi:hypothetical protein
MDASKIREAVVKASVSGSKRLQFAVQIGTQLTPAFYECPHVSKRDDNFPVRRLLFYPFKITNWCCRNSVEKLICKAVVSARPTASENVNIFAGFRSSGM